MKRYYMYDPVSRFAGAGVSPPWYGSHHGRRTTALTQPLLLVSHVGGAYTHCSYIAHGMYLNGIHPSVKNAPFHSGGMMMVARTCMHIAHGIYVSVTRPSVENAPFHTGGGDDHGMECIPDMFLVLYSGSNYMGVPPTTRNWCVYST